MDMSCKTELEGEVARFIIHVQTRLATSQLREYYPLIGNFARESFLLGRHLVFDVLFYGRRDCPLKATINSLSWYKYFDTSNNTFVERSS